MGKKVYEKIKELRLKQGFSQRELGDAIGLSQQAIALLEKGKRKLDVETLENIISILQPTFSEYMDILDFDYEKEKNEMTQMRSNIIRSRLSPLSEKGQQNALEILSYLWELNHKGQKKAIEQVEMLTKIEEYTKKD